MKIKIQYQYFESCPNHIKMLVNLFEAVKGIENYIEFEKVIIEDEETAKKLKFLGSPALLINGKDLLGALPPENISLSCRFYPNGIPSSEEIRKKIIEIINFQAASRI